MVLRHICKVSEYGIEASRAYTLRNCVLSLRSLPHNYVVTLSCLVPKGGYFFRLVLQVAVHHHHPLPLCHAQSGRYSLVLAKVSAEIYASHVLVLLA